MSVSRCAGVFIATSSLRFGARLAARRAPDLRRGRTATRTTRVKHCPCRSEEHTSELQSLMRISYAVFCLKKKNNHIISHNLTNGKNMHNKKDHTNSII